jgi:hypothetical protein
MACGLQIEADSNSGALDKKALRAMEAPQGLYKLCMERVLLLCAAASQAQSKCCKAK